MKIKICGLFRDADCDYVSEAMPDYIGFVFAPSRRQVSLDDAKRLRDRLHPAIKVVGVFIGEPRSTILAALDREIIDLVQLHGPVSDAFAASLGAPVIRAVAAGERVPLPAVADYLLFDAPAPGSGKRFDWTTLPPTEKPFFIAGGIDSTNLSEAMTLGGYAVDISSGAERGGYKDYEKIMELVRRIRHG